MVIGSMRDEAQYKYREILMDIKRRMAVIDAFQNRNAHAVYRVTTMESSCLQLRKILELVAFGSLVANKDVYSAQHKKFASHWNAKLLLKDLSRLNPEFYPRPIAQKPSLDPNIKSDWQTLDDDQFMTQSEFVKVYEKCGSVMHADNPFASKRDTSFYETNVPIWTSKIVGLLQAHTIRLVGDEMGIYLFQMNAENRYPSFTPFTRIEKK